MTGVRRWIAAFWPLALLLVFLGTFRRTAGDSSTVRDLSLCEAPFPSDMVALERCLALDPRNIELMIPIGDAYGRSGATDRAEAIYRRALSVDPHDGDVHLRLGELLLTRGDAAAARTEGEAALESQPGSLAAARLVERAAAALRH